MKRFDLRWVNNVPLSYQIWRVMCQAPVKVLTACYMPNEQRRREAKSRPSFLVKHLTDDAWVPDRVGNFHKPNKMIREDLPDEFVYDDTNGWLTAVGFGAQVEAEKFEQEETTKRLRKEGIDLSLEDLKALSEIPKEDLHSLLDEYKERIITTIYFPEVAPKNPERRKKKIEKRYQDDPEKKSEKRPRTVSVSKPTVDPREYLEGLYTNDDDQLVCQMCRKEMPFKLRDGRYYFEAVQLIDDFKKESRELYLALCPECAAKYKLLVKKHADTIASFKAALPTIEWNTEHIFETHDTNLPQISIRFVETHLEDIRTVMVCENNAKKKINVEELVDELSRHFLGERIPLDVLNKETGDVLVNAGRKITKTCIRKIAENAGAIEMAPSPISIKIMSIIDRFIG